MSVPVQHPPFSFQQLRVFVAVSKRLSVTRAAASLGMSQPAASQALRELERRLGERLFEREKNRLRLTWQGEQLLGPAIDVLETAADMTRVVSHRGDALAGVLSMGASTTIGNHLLPAWLASFRRRHPALRIQADVTDTAELFQRVLARDLPFALVEGRVHDPEVYVVPYARDRMVLVCRPDHPWVEAGQVTAREVAAAPFIAREEGSGTRTIIEDRFALAGLSLASRIELGNTEAIKTAIMQGLGVSMISRVAIERELKSGLLATVQVSDLSLSRDFQMIRRRDRRLSPVASHFLTQNRVPLTPPG